MGFKIDIMNANDIAPNLYEEWGLDRRDGAHELLVLLESKDLQLQQQGQDAEEPRRAQLRAPPALWVLPRRGRNTIRRVRQGCAPPGVI